MLLSFHLLRTVAHLGRAQAMQADGCWYGPKLITTRLTLLYVNRVWVHSSASASRSLADGAQCVDLLPRLAVQKSRGAHPRLRCGTALSYQQRWSGLVPVGLMKAVAAAASRNEGADLATALLEPEPGLAGVLI